MPQDLKSEMIDLGVAPELASLFAQHSRELPKEVLQQNGLGLLEQTRSNPTSPAVIVSKHPRNLLINWKELLFSVLPTTVGAITATTAAPITGGLALLAAVYQLIGTCQIELGESHAEVVRSLWVELKDIQPVDQHELTSLVSPANSEKLPGILNDLKDLGIVELLKDNQILKKDRLVLKNT